MLRVLPHSPSTGTPLMSAWFEANLLLDKRRQESIFRPLSYLYNNNSISSSLTHHAAQNINTEAPKKKPSREEGLGEVSTAPTQTENGKYFRKLQKEFSCHYAN
jgi:hypothetical protein